MIDSNKIAIIIALIFMAILFLSIINVLKLKRKKVLELITKIREK